MNEMTHMEEEKESLRKEAVTVIELKDKEKKHNVVFVKNGIEIGKAHIIGFFQARKGSGLKNLHSSILFPFFHRKDNRKEISWKLHISTRS